MCLHCKHTARRTSKSAAGCQHQATTQSYSRQLFYTLHLIEHSEWRQTMISMKPQRQRRIHWSRQQPASDSRHGSSIHGSLNHSARTDFTMLWTTRPHNNGQECHQLISLCSQTSLIMHVCKRMKITMPCRFINEV